MKINTNTPLEANAKGFATFNNVPHICIDAPDGNSTVTIKTSEGKMITISLLAYTTGGAPQCVDVVSHAHAGIEHETFPQNVRVFNKGLTPYFHDPACTDRVKEVKANPPTLTTIVLLPTE